MNALRVFAFAASLAFSSAQLTTVGANSANGVAVGGPLDAMSNTAANTPQNTPANTQMNSGWGNTGNSGYGMNSMFGMNNPMMPFALMSGGDTMRRMAMMPAFRQFGPVTSYYYMRSGFDKAGKAMGADMMSRMLQQSMGLPPWAAAMMSGRFMDAPDGYGMMNFLLNSGGMMGNSMNSMQSNQQTGNVPNGAAMGSQQTSNNNGGGIFNNPGMLAALSFGMF